MNRSISIIVSSNELPMETRKFQDYKIQETSLRQQDLSAMEMVWEEENEVAFKNRSKTQGRLPIIPGDHRRQGIFFQAGISPGTPFPRDIPPTERLGRSSSFHHSSYPPRVIVHIQNSKNFFQQTRTQKEAKEEEARQYRLEHQETNYKLRIMSAVNNIKGGERRVAASRTKGVGSESRQTLWRLSSPWSTMLINERRAAPEIPAALTILNQRWYSWAPLSPNPADNATRRLAWVMQTKYRTFNERKYRDASAKRFFTVPRHRRESFHRVGSQLRVSKVWAGLANLFLSRNIGSFDTGR